MVGLDYVLDMYRTNKILKEDVFVLIETVFYPPFKNTNLTINQLEELLTKVEQKRGDFS